MDTWSGFSDAELRRLKHKQKETGRQREQRRAATQSTRPLQVAIATEEQEEDSSQAHSMTPHTATIPSLSSSSSSLQSSSAVPNGCHQRASVADEVTSKPRPRDEPGLGLSSPCVELTTISFNPPDNNLQLLTEQRQQIEEENKRKKALLEKTIQERYKQSMAEAHTLASVKQQLDKLDCLVSHDVAVLRDKIENANREYDNARRRFENAEKEYVFAKINLHKATELKELLSEHLCAVVQENELRKAKKLTQLTAALKLAEGNLGGDEGGFERSKLFQRTPTPHSETWPRRPQEKPSHSVAHSQNSLENATEGDKECAKTNSDETNIGGGGGGEGEREDSSSEVTLATNGGAITLD